VIGWRTGAGTLAKPMCLVPVLDRTSCYRVLKNDLQSKLDFPHRHLSVLIDLAEARIVLK